MTARFTSLLLLLFYAVAGLSQSNNSSPYCHGGYGSGQCNQTGASNSPGNFINDFINDFYTTGANVNIVNNNSGCNGLNNNYIYYGCQHYLSVSPGQTIVCNMKSGIIFNQSFAFFIDWNQDNVFQNPGEMVAATSNAPAANTWTTLNIVIPANQPPGTYRLRLRCAYSIAGTQITPCGQHSHGETEDYNLYIGTIPPTIMTATAGISNGTVCAGETVTMNVNYTGGTATPTITWTGPASYSSSAQNPIFTPTTQTQSGTYTVLVDNGACPTTQTVALSVVNYPQFIMAPATPTICQGGNFMAQALFAGGVNTGDYNFNWAPTTGAGTIFSSMAPATPIIPLPLPVTQSVATVQYSVTVTPKAHYCPVTKALTVTINNPFSPTLNLTAPVCDISQQVQFSGQPAGGTWSGNGGVAAGGLLTPSLAAIGTNTVKYTVAIGNCTVANSGTFSVSKYHTPALTSSLNLVCVQDPSFNLMTLVQDTVTGLWSGPSVSQNRLFTPQGLATGVYTFTYNTWSTPIASVCPASTVLAVQVFNPPTPTITAILPRCNNSGSVQLTATPQGGTWATGGGVSAAGILTPSLASIGTNQVFYSAGQGTCVATGSRTFHVSQYNTSALTQKIPEHCVSQSPYPLMSIVQNTTGTWIGTGVSGAIFNPANLAGGVYTLTYSTKSFPDITLCPEQSTVSVKVLNPPTPVIQQAGPFCSRDGAVQLNVMPDIGQWVNTPYLGPDGTFTPALAPIGFVPVEYVIGTATCNASSKISISIESFIPASLTQSELPDLCNTSAAINLQPYSVYNSGAWHGQGLQGAIFNPLLSGTGRFVLEYHTASMPSGLCPDKSTLSVNVFSLAPPMLSAGGPYCSNQAPIQLTVSPIGGFFEGVNNNAVTIGGLFRPAEAPAGLNVVNYSITSGPCVAHAQATLSVEKFVSAALHTEGLAFCNTDYPYNLHSLAINPGYYWSGTAVDANGMFNPQKAGTGPVQLVYRTYASVTNSTCPDQTTVMVRVDEQPDVDPVSTAYEGCAPLSVQLSAKGANGGKGEWYFDDGSGHVHELSAGHTFTAPGSYSVAFNYTAGACRSTSFLKQPITVLLSPLADFEFSRTEIFISEPQVDLINKSIPQGGNKYVWRVEKMGEYYEVNPSIQFPVAGRYGVTLTASGGQGCESRITKYIEVQNDFHVFVPNSFTPNFDQINDVFTPVFSPYGLDPKTYHMEIFDRWGHLVFETGDLATGWNGTFRNTGEEPLKEDVYIYRITFRDLEGRNYKKNGTVTLLHGL